VPLRDYSNGPHRRGRLASSGTLKSFGLGAILLILLALGVWLYLKSRRASVSTDTVTLCPTNRPPTEVVVILLDVSDEFSEPQRLQIRNHLARIRDRIRRFGLVEVYSLDRLGRRVTEPLMHICNPGTGADLNPIYQNPRLAHDRWSKFTAALEAEIADVTAGEALKTSLIFEAIQATALRTFGLPEYDGIERRLVIVSDLLQNAPEEINMYGSVPTFERFSSTPYFSRVRADLRNVQVSVLYLTRSGVLTQGRSHIAFWENYLKAQGAVLESVERVFGDR
jgi:hypothetical protein